MQVDPSALDDIKARLDDLDDAVRGITSLVSALVLMDRDALTQEYRIKVVTVATENIIAPHAFESTRT